MERGTVIHADMAIFQLGPTALGLAQPVGPGVCADALARRSPGPFQPCRIYNRRTIFQSFLEFFERRFWREVDRVSVAQSHHLVLKLRDRHCFEFGIHLSNHAD